MNQGGYMKRGIGIILLLVFICTVPNYLNYQGKLLDSSGVGINDTLDVTFRLYGHETDGETLWEETIPSVIFEKGLFSVILGQVETFPDTVDFSSQYWLEIEINDEIIEPRERLSASPYAFRAISSNYTDNAIQNVSSTANILPRTGNMIFSADSGVTISDTGDSIIIHFAGVGGEGTTAPQSLSQVLAVGNSAEGFNLNMNFNRIFNLGEPTEDDDAVRKQYVDNLDGEGLSFSSQFDVNVDNLTIYIDTDTLKVKEGGITGTHIADSTITGIDIATRTIDRTHIIEGTLTNEEIAEGGINSYNILDGTITSDDIAEGSINPDRIAPNSITANQIAPQTITNEQIADNTITGSQLYWDDITPMLGDSLFYAGGISLKYSCAEDISALDGVYMSSWLAGWDYRMPITITNNNPSLVQFQVLLELASGFSWGHCQSDGKDVRIVDTDGSTQIPYWFENWNYNSNAKIWTKIPSIPAMGSKTIYIYYGNNTVSDEQSFDNTFTKRYGEGNLIALWSMDEAAGSTLPDSSGRFNNGSIIGATWAEEDGGQWDSRSDVNFSEGSYLVFDGVDDYVSVPDATSLRITDALTIECWIDGSGNYCDLTKSWWNRNWSYRRNIELTPATNIDNYQIQLIIDSSFDYTHFQANGEDLRFLDNSDDLLDYWIEEWNVGGSSIIWVNVENSGTSEIMMYYGNGLVSYGSVSYFDIFPILGDGSDGDVTITGSVNINSNIIVSGRTYPDGVFYQVNAIGSNTITTSTNANGITSGDEILLINLQGNTSYYGNVGKNEFLQVASVSGNIITLESSISQIYGASTSNSNLTGQKIIVQRVPNYNNVTINGTLTSSAWNGSTGGVLAFRALRTVSISSSGYINLDGKGYRGGPRYGCHGTDYQYGYVGESERGGYNSVRQGNSFGIGGGAGNGQGTGGGGGYGTTGTNGQCAACADDYGRGGNAIGETTIGELYFGGGGGASGAHSSGGREGAYGGNGGGIISIFANTLTINGNISTKGSNGENGYIPPTQCISGGSGGSGGTIKLISESITISGSINALGGIGGNAPAATGTCGPSPCSSTPYCVAGANGALGRVRLDSETLSGSSNPSPYTASFYNPERDRRSSTSTPIVSLNNEQTLNGIHKGDSYGLLFSSATQINGFIDDNFISTNLSSGWNHIAIIYNGTSLKLYVNGSESATASLTGAISTNSEPFIIGEKFDGKIDELRIYDRALPSGEIQAHYERRRFSDSDPSKSFEPEETASAIGLRKASASSEYQATHFLGIATESGIVGDSIAVRISGVAQGFSSLTIGADYYLSNTAGGIEINPGTVSRRVGTAIATDRLLITR